MKLTQYPLAFACLCILGIILFFSYHTHAESPPVGEILNSVFIHEAERMMSSFVNILEKILFYKVLGFPLMVVWLVAGGLYFTIRLGFINFKLFGHAIQVVRGKFSSEDDPGEVTHFEALSAAVSATVGLGNIAGVAVAVSLGGPGAVVWMMVAGILGMSTKFAEVTMGQKYRTFDAKGRVSGGAFLYLSKGLAELNYPLLGKILAVIFSVFCIGGALGGGNMFQSNQTVTILTDSFGGLSSLDWIIALLLAVSVGIVLIGGIRRIAHVAEAIVPLMAMIYILAAMTVLLVNAEHVPSAFIFMFEDAFTGTAVGGGIIGAIIQGFRRAAFSNEAGLGSAPIAHAAAKTNEPVREGCVALLEPFIDTVVICFMTGLVITVTGVYQDSSIDGGVLLSSAAFATVIDWFPMVLSVCIALFAYSTMITWSYYGERAWLYLFGKRTLGIYHVLFCTATFLGGVIEFGVILTFSDLLILSMAIPNLIGLYMLSGVVKRELDQYLDKLRRGEFVVNQ